MKGLDKKQPDGCVAHRCGPFTYLLRYDSHPCGSHGEEHYNYRKCKSCGKIQYKYRGKWEDELTLQEFCRRWIGDMGNGPEYDTYLTIDVSLPFEAFSHEAWDMVFRVTFIRGDYAGHSSGWYPDLNAVDDGLRRDRLITVSEKPKRAGEDFLLLPDIGSSREKR